MQEQIRSIDNGIELIYPSEEVETADVIIKASGKSMDIIKGTWGIFCASDIRIYVITSLLRFVFCSSPWSMRILYALSFPLWYFRWRKVWQFAGGFTLRYSQRPAIGIKPPHLIAETDSGIGGTIYIQYKNRKRRLEHIICHELVHANCAHLKLPLWLNEGLAMATVDIYFSMPTVRKETLKILNNPSYSRLQSTYRSLPKMKKESIVYQYVRGYWLVCFLMEKCPQQMKEILQRKTTHQRIEKQIAEALDISPSVFWKIIDQKLIDHFGK